MKIYRNQDVILGNADLEHLYTFHNFPAFMGCTNQPFENDILADLRFCVSRSSGMIQLNPILPAEIIYQSTHNSGAVGKVWEQHHREFAKFIKDQSPSAALEVGGGHGLLASYYQENIPWTIFEPNPTPVGNCPATFVKEFFTETTDINLYNFDTIIHSHVFEHVFNPDKFIRLIANSLKQGQRMIFSIPNMKKMMEQRYSNFLNFEHTFLLSEEYVEYLLSKHGFKLVAQHYYTDHSIFYAWERIADKGDVLLPEGLYKKYKKLFEEYISYYENITKTLNVEVSKSKNYYLFGAHIFSQFLIKAGLSTDKLSYILDNDPNKHHKRLYGTNFFVRSPKILAGLENPLVIVRAGAFTEEIKKDILENINSSTIFL